MKAGKVYLIGAGPGDPSLITVRGADVLGRCDVVLYDALAHPAILDHAREGAELVFVGKRGGHTESEDQTTINAELVRHAREGKTVGRLKGGDPLLFARGGEEALVLAEAGIPFEIVPGIASPVAVSAYAGIPLTHREMASSVLFLTGHPRKDAGPDGHDWKRLATRAGTICVLMGMKRIREIASSLIEHGRDPKTPTAVVQWGARPEQRTIVAPLEEIADAAERAKMESPAVIVIGQVVSLREKLRWFDAQPLFGKRVLVTRAKEQAGDVAKELLERGAHPVIAPTIAIQPPADPEPLRRAARELASYDWVAFTSANGVARLFAELDAASLDARAFGAAKVASIGPSTAAALASRGIRADLVAEKFVGEALAEAILSRSKRGDRPENQPFPRVLLPRAKVARDAFPAAIRAAGGAVDVVVAYETHPPDEAARAALRDEIERGVDVVLLTSSSTAENLVRILGDDALALLARSTIASIGPITTETATKLGLHVAVTAETFTVPGLLDALEHRMG